MRKRTVEGGIRANLSAHWLYVWSCIGGAYNSRETFSMSKYSILPAGSSVDC